MRTVLLLAVAASGVVLGGCGHEGTALAHQDPDGAKCLPDTPQRAVYIEVEMAKGAPPKVLQDPCMVYAGGTITWRGPAKGVAGFKVDFHSKEQGALDALRKSGGMMKSSAAADSRQKFTLTAWSKDGNYTYDISSEAGGTDPTIIIRPN